MGGKVLVKVYFIIYEIFDICNLYYSWGVKYRNFYFKNYIDFCVVLVNLSKIWILYII